MSIYELNAKAWDEHLGINCEKTMIIVGNLKWPSQEAFDKAMKRLYDSVIPLKHHEETKTTCNMSVSHGKHN